MFEKDAEEYATTGYDKKLLTKEQITVLKCGRYDGFQKGAEFGYNKANEWHYVKDGDLPTHTRQVLVYLKSDDVDIDCYGKGLGWKNHLNEQIKAWKEIVPPKENE